MNREARLKKVDQVGASTLLRNVEQFTQRFSAPIEKPAPVKRTTSARAICERNRAILFADKPMDPSE